MLKMVNKALLLLLLLYDKYHN